MSYLHHYEYGYLWKLCRTHLLGICQYHLRHVSQIQFRNLLLESVEVLLHPSRLSAYSPLVRRKNAKNSLEMNLSGFKLSEYIAVIVILTTDTYSSP